MKKRTWGDLSPGTRKLLLGTAVFDVILRLLALRDLVGRRDAEVRGSRIGWGVSLVTVSSGGLLPLVYFLRARRDPLGRRD